MKVLVTGGMGFIGSAVVRHLIAHTEAEVVNLDALTYAATPATLAHLKGHPRYRFVRGDICDAALVRVLFAQHRPDAVMHLAAESHVDRSIEGPAVFVRTNVVGTGTMLDAALAHWRGLDAMAQAAFRFHHISTDEVFGSLGADGFFHEDTPYDPSSPYSASKAGADHLVRAYGRTFRLPVLLTNCSNNYGPYHFPEKLIPLVIIKALSGQPLPVYGTGSNVRDWLYVDDHASALWLAVTKGRVGESYNVGGNNERRNIDVVRAICRQLDELLPESPFLPHERLITFVTDRPGHDHRYAIDAGKIRSELGWQPKENFETGIAKTVRWYLDNRAWWEPLAAGYQSGRLGLDSAIAPGQS